jgi:hypothetical protein
MKMRVDVTDINRGLDTEWLVSNFGDRGIFWITDFERGSTENEITGT